MAWDNLASTYKEQKILSAVRYLSRITHSMHTLVVILIEVLLCTYKSPILVSQAKLLPLIEVLYYAHAQRDMG